MLRFIKNKFSQIRGLKNITLSVCTLLLTTLTVGSTYAYMVTGTPSLTNLFINGLDHTGDLTLHKTLSHPFGDTYVLPENLRFTFNVNLGADYADKTIKTSQGDITADSGGVLTVTVVPGGRTTVFGIEKDTAVTITETALPAGFTPETETADVVIQWLGDNPVSFNNIYSPAQADTAALTVRGEKNIIGRDWIEGDSFTFDLSVQENDEWKSLGIQTVAYYLVEQPDPENPDRTITVPAPDFNRFDFSQLIQAYSFDHAGLYQFRITEVEGSVGGINYDKTESRFDISVGDVDMDGRLEIQSVITASTNTLVEDKNIHIVFNNNYAPEGSAEITVEIQKNLEDTSGQRKSPAGFTFDLLDQQGTLVKTSSPTDSAGKTAISMVYRPSDAGKEFVYTLQETHSGETADFITYDNTQYRIKVSVVDNLDGTVSAYVSEFPVEQPQLTTQQPAVETPAEQPVENTADADSTALQSVSEETASPETETPAEEAAPQTSETVTEPEIQPEPPVSEEAAAGDEQLLAAEQENTEEPQPEAPSNIWQATFTNTYDPQDASAVITGRKILSGRDIKDKEFSFYLLQTDKDFKPLAENGTVEKVTSDAEGVITFTALNFDKVGVYHYVVLEDATQPLGGVTYDDTYYFVTVIVKDNNGILEAAVYTTDSYGAEKNIEFVNSYKASPAYLSLPGRKVLNNAELKAGDFYFQIYTADASFAATGDLVQTVTNDGEGNFSFKDLAFQSAGTYHFIIKEDSTAAKEGITYDESMYHITVEVSDPGTGQLVISNFGIAEAEGTATSIVFENAYIAPVEPEPTITPQPSATPTQEPTVTPGPDAPDTGDNTNAVIYLAVFAAALAGLVIMLVLKRKNIKENGDNDQ